jgi:hypothetical protein
MSLEMQNHTHRLQSSLIHQKKVTMWPYLHDETCKITHTDRSCLQVDLARRSTILLHVVIEQAPLLLTA